jgi:tetratricopeptide (TPR) repeat protein
LEAFRRAAVLGESTHHDYIAANAWVQLALATVTDEVHPQRALEYVAYAEAVLERVGHPPRLEAMVSYAKGASLVTADRMQEAEVSFRHAVDVAEREGLDELPLAIQGLGFLYEQQGRYQDAIDAYRGALGRLPKAGVVPSQVTFRERLAVNLSSSGKHAEAEMTAREAVALADRLFSANDQDRYAAHVILAQILQDAGTVGEALAEAKLGVEGLRRILGERSAPYAEALTLEADVLGDAGRPKEADELLARACEIIAYHVDESSKQAECWIRRVSILDQLGREREALALVDRAIPLFVKAFGEAHPEVANAYIERAGIYSNLHRTAEAIADFERGLADFERVAGIESGYLAAGHAGLGEELWATDRARARKELEMARSAFATAAPSWAKQRRDFEAFVASHRE